MNEIKKILVLIESREQAQHLIVKSQTLAEAVGATVEVFTCCYSQSLSNSYLFDREAREHGKIGFIHGVERWLDELIEPLLEKNMNVSTDVYWDRHLEQGMMTKIERYQPDLVIKDCRYHHRLDQHLLGHVDWELIRHCPVPLMLVRPAAWSEAPIIVAAIDPIRSHEKTASLDMRILDNANHLCHWIGGRLNLFHCFQPLPTSVIFDDTVMFDYDQLRDKLRQTHLQAMEELLDQFGLPASGMEAHLSEGEAHQELPAYLTEASADIVVMGAVERGIIDRFFVGTTSEMALDHISCDLLIVKDRTAVEEE
ncbi:universal stress protein [Motiliproteus sp. MSK22-1]|uniref:universal stress protein n=1 Tax=Motiliproteus sp. MSK22-1 TaxID=1897630 RepID=UPI000975F03B|nr:universal stress protein [Motiliproteus sp. MSK22-1]OMH25234.1 hypothetical protein BGP75_25855 [Motiliproteus sp. MSK22-1]